MVCQIGEAVNSGFEKEGGHDQEKTRQDRRYFMGGKTEICLNYVNSRAKSSN